MRDFAIEDLPGELSGLFEHRAAVLGVGVVAEFRAFFNKTQAVSIDDDAEWVAMLLKAFANVEITKFGCIAIPSDGMASRPVAVGHRANFQCHADAVAGVEA